MERGQIQDSRIGALEQKVASLELRAKGATTPQKDQEVQDRISVLEQEVELLRAGKPQVDGHDDDVWEVRFIMKKGRIVQMGEYRVPQGTTVATAESEPKRHPKQELSQEERHAIRDRLVAGKAKKLAAAEALRKATVVVSDNKPVPDAMERAHAASEAAKVEMDESDFASGQEHGKHLVKVARKEAKK